MLIHVFLTSRIDYCNALLGGCSARLTKQMTSSCFYKKKKKKDCAMLACRRSVFRMLVHCLFVLLLCFTNSLNCSRLSYDRFTLLSLRSAALEICSQDLNMKLFAEQSFTFQPPMKDCHETGCRRQGTRAGVLVKRKKLGNLNRKAQM